MTIVICSFQRRRQLSQLLSALSDSIRTGATDAEGIDVVVVLDGSTDGSKEMADALNFPTPMFVIWQENRGLAAARNRGIASALGTIVWLLDDDLMPEPDCLMRHRRAHEAVDPIILMGPCLLPPTVVVHPEYRRFFETQYLELAGDGEVSRFNTFSAANMSGPVQLLLEHKLFDDSFTEYGVEDWELACRLLEAGVTIRYDANAVAWHHPEHSVVTLYRRAWSQGRNMVRLAQIHPGTTDALFPRRPENFGYRLLAETRLYRRPRVLRSISKALLGVAALEVALTQKRAWRVFRYAYGLNLIASVLNHDVEGRLTDRVLRRTCHKPHSDSDDDTVHRPLKGTFRRDLKHASTPSGSQSQDP